MSQYDRYNMQRTLTLRADIAGEDLGSAARRVAQAIAEAGTPPPRVSVTLRGQAAPMAEMLDGLQRGLMIAIGAIFLLLAANFQSLKLSIVVMSTAPAALAGVDSSIIVALMQRNSTTPVKTFTIGFPIPEYDESKYAALVARHLGTDHHVLEVKPDALEVLPKLAYH